MRDNIIIGLVVIVIALQLYALNCSKKKLAVKVQPKAQKDDEDWVSGVLASYHARPEDHDL